MVRVFGFSRGLGVNRMVKVGRGGKRLKAPLAPPFVLNSQKTRVFFLSENENTDFTDVSY